MAKTVCVTGAGGYIASWIVLKLLEKGYTVHGTVRNPDDDKKYGHLKQLEGAKERLTLFQADVLDYDSLVTAIRGCDAVFHTACPFFFHFEKPEDVLDPALKGTENVLRACHEEKIKRVIMTSSGAAVMWDPNRPADAVVDENNWTDSDHCRETKAWYLLAKTESEKLAWKLSKEYNFNLVVICPAYTFGPLLQSTVNESVAYLKQLIDGSQDSYPTTPRPVSDVRDIAKAHILALENESALGRYFCVGWNGTHEEMLNILKNKFPHLPYAHIAYDDGQTYYSVKVCNDKALSLIGEFTPIEQTLVDTVVSLQEKGFLPK